MKKFKSFLASLKEHATGEEVRVLDYKRSLKEAALAQYITPHGSLPAFAPMSWAGKPKKEYLSTGVVELKAVDGQLMYRSRSWKRKYAVLRPVHPRGATLTFYKDSSEAAPRGTLVLTPDSFVLETHLNPASFVLITPFVALHLTARTTDERTAWMSALQRRLEGCSDVPHLPQQVLTSAAGHVDARVHVAYEKKRCCRQSSRCTTCFRIRKR